MATYLYRCPEHHESTARFPVGEAEPEVSCACGAPARRVFTAPMLATLDTRTTRALDTAGRSADAPEVVRDVPSAGRRSTPVSTDPRHARLPRP